MSDSIEMSQTTKTGKGGLIHGLKRVMGGGGILLTKYEAHKAPGLVTFGTKVPGSIFPLQLGNGQEFLLHRDGWICATPGVQPSVGFQHSLRGSIFGGEGFVLEKLEGDGTAWVEIAGEVTSYDLAKGQSLRVHPGHVGAFQTTVKFEVQRLKGIVNRHFGDDGFHVVRLEGPGRVYLMSMPLPLLAGSLQPYLEPAE
jgi:uncharacterized protein (AIM24 family)